MSDFQNVALTLTLVNMLLLDFFFSLFFTLLPLY